MRGHGSDILRVGEGPNLATTGAAPWPSPSGLPSLRAGDELSSTHRPGPAIAHGIPGLRSLVGIRLGPSRPLLIEQERIDSFAAATGDHQWIHVDQERAEHGPFGTTIAHGYLTLSLCAHFLQELLEVLDVAMGINYGTVRFPSPVLAGSELVAEAEIT